MAAFQTDHSPGRQIFSVRHCSFAYPFSSAFPSLFAQLFNAANLISQRISSRLLCLNPYEFEFIITGLHDQIRKIPDLAMHLSTNCSSLTFPCDVSLRSLRVTP